MGKLLGKNLVVSRRRSDVEGETCRRSPGIDAELDDRAIGRVEATHAYVGSSEEARKNMVPRTSKPAAPPVADTAGCTADTLNDQHPSRKPKRGPRLVVDCLRRRPSVVLLLLPAALLASLYVVSSEEDYDFEPRSLFKSYHVAKGNYLFIISSIP